MTANKKEEGAFVIGGYYYVVTDNSICKEIEDFHVSFDTRGKRLGEFDFIIDRPKGDFGKISKEYDDSVRAVIVEYAKNDNVMEMENEELLEICKKKTLKERFQKALDNYNIYLNKVESFESVFLPH